ncbi:hypothetical protein HGA91_01995 [candidate division WWE3 bacterium]|nr:hypothetical protein [candidate division WWE3 bacterium]
MESILQKIKPLLSKFPKEKFIEFIKPTRQKVIQGLIIFVFVYIGSQFYEYRCEYSLICVAKNIVFGILQVFAFPVFIWVYLLRLDIWGLIIVSFGYSYLLSCAVVSFRSWRQRRTQNVV